MSYVVGFGDAVFEIGVCWCRSQSRINTISTRNWKKPNRTARASERNFTRVAKPTPP